MTYVEVAQVHQMARGLASSYPIGETTIALFSVEGAIYAVDDCCIRCGSSISCGALIGSEVTCRRCGWQYDVRNGRVHGLPALHIDTYEVRIVDSRVMVDTKYVNPGS